MDRDLAYSSAELDLLLPELLADARIAGLSYCLIRENELTHCGVFGVTNAETGQPVSATKD